MSTHQGHFEMQDSPVYPRWVHCRHHHRLRDIPYDLFKALTEECVQRFVEPILPPPRRAWVKAVCIETFAPHLQESRIETIETATGQKLSIAPKPTAENTGKCHPQDRSPLFNKLPSEIRMFVYKLATEPYVDPAHRFSKRDINYRPGNEGLLVQSVSVLRTCRLVWLEGNALPAQQSEYCFWFREWLSGSDDTRPTAYRRQKPIINDHFPERYRMLAAVDHLPMHMKQPLHHLHLFASIARLQAFGCTEDERDITIDLLRDFRAKHVTVTVRHFDWWDWSKQENMNGSLRKKLNMMFSDQEALQLSAHVVRYLLKVFSKLEVDQFHLELETAQHKIGQLLPIIAELQHDFLGQPVMYEYSKPNGRALLLQDGCREDTWTGPADGTWPNAYEYAALDHLRYRCFTLTWKREPALEIVHAVQPSNKEGTPENALKERQRLRERYERRFAKQNSLLAFI